VKQESHSEYVRATAILLLSSYKTTRHGRGRGRGPGP